ncbi:MAG: prepilin-type N-terminal cleavage/methylation domain-containing protein [Nitrospirae bacterium]|nr:prepilin-type N-terminal cleavage/methylation domain-containing protein [Nitrospirota bacterium]MBI3378477.1 prepilin-type N-terminal cleavage/methylation domain-containing protein [Nitrospirota bacterium]
MKDCAGVTLIELITVISIIGVLVFALGFSFQDWNAAYKIESQIKEMHSDIMHARVRAMCKKRAHFVKLEAAQYTIYEDTNPMPDGNNTLETEADNLVVQKASDYPIEFNLGFGDTQFRFDKDGSSSRNGRIRLVSTASPDYDCIKLFSTRINLGKWDSADCNAK